MYIEKASNLNKIELNKDNKVISSKKAKNSSIGGDKIALSQDALAVHKARQAVLAQPNIRAERVQIAQERLNNGDYDTLDAKILDKIAEKIALYLLR